MTAEIVETRVPDNGFNRTLFLESVVLLQRQQSGEIKVIGITSQEEYLLRLGEEHSDGGIGTVVIANNCVDPSYTNVWTKGNGHKNVFILEPHIDPLAGVDFPRVDDRRTYKD